MKTSYKFILALALGITLTNCSTQNVQRVNENTVIDLSGLFIDS